MVYELLRFCLVFPRSLVLPGNAHGRLCLQYIIVFEAEPQTPIPSRSLGTSSIMFNNGWVDEFLGMFDICFSMILLIT